MREQHQAPAPAPAAADDGDSSTAASSDTQQPASRQLPHLLPKQHVLPWEVVDALPRTSPFSLEALASGGIRGYLAYLRAGRLGVPTVFDLGIVKGQGREGRRHLLQRERLLGFVLQHLQQQHVLQHLRHTQHARSSSSGSSILDGSGWLNHLPQEQQQPDQQQQQQSGLMSQAEWQPSDEELEELSEGQIEAVAAAAAASGTPLFAGVTPADVAQCLVDYFVFNRCVCVCAGGWGPAHAALVHAWLAADTGFGVHGLCMACAWLVHGFQQTLVKEPLMDHAGTPLVCVLNIWCVYVGS